MTSIVDLSIRFIGPGGRTNIICHFSARARLYYQIHLRRNNGTDGQIIGCYANGHDARVKSGITPGARQDRHSAYSRLSEEASALSAARFSGQQGGKSEIHADFSGDLDFFLDIPKELIDMAQLDADSINNCTVENDKEFLVAKKSSLAVKISLRRNCILCIGL
jgi:hypothetical protein